jgi:hypothetical protein
MAAPHSCLLLRLCADFHGADEDEEIAAVGHQRARRVGIVYRVGLDDLGGEGCVAGKCGTATRQAEEEAIPTFRGERLGQSQTAYKMTLADAAARVAAKDCSSCHVY